MNLHDVVISSIKNIFFAVIITALVIPILLSVPGLSGMVLNALSVVGIGTGN